MKRFLMNREVNREFYRRVPADKLDYRMVDTKTRRSDSPRESLLHQLSVVLITHMLVEVSRRGRTADGGR